MGPPERSFLFPFSFVGALGMKRDSTAFFCPRFKLRRSELHMWVADRIYPRIKRSEPRGKTEKPSHPKDRMSC